MFKKKLPSKEGQESVVKKWSTYKKDKGIKTGWNIQYLGEKKKHEMT